MFTTLVLLPAHADEPPTEEAWQVVPDEVIVKFFSDADPPAIDDLISKCDSVVKVESNVVLDAADAPDSDSDDELDDLTRNLFWLELSGGQSVDDAIACFLAQPDLVESAEPNILSDPSTHPPHPSDTHSEEPSPAGPVGAEPRSHPRLD